MPDSKNPTSENVMLNQDPNQMNKKWLYAGVAVVVIVIALLFFFRGQSKQTALQSPSPSPLTGIVGVPTIERAVLSRSIDAKGNATGVAITFNSKTDKIVYAVLTLKNVTKNTKLSYVRYLNGKYVDSKVALASKDGITNFYFAFEKGVGDYPKGTYTLNLYVNGRHTQTLTYVFK